MVAIFRQPSITFVFSSHDAPLGETTLTFFTAEMQTNWIGKDKGLPNLKS
jgi:hypothetical protein